MWTLYSLDTCIISSVPNWTEHGASMVGEFLSGGVCQKENGENCSAEATMDGRLTKWKVNVSACTWGGGLGRRFLFKCKSMFVCESLEFFHEAGCTCLCEGLYVLTHFWLAQKRFVPPSYKSRRLGGHGIKTDWANWGLSGSWVIHQGFRLFRLCGLTVPSLRLNVGAHSWKVRD